MNMAHFPSLNPEMRKHSEAVLDHIRSEINQAGGMIPFARFMELALYSPGLGYYSAGLPKLGKTGDFVTAPELSPLFANCLARQFSEILTTLPSGDILELGAGTGIFAKDVLATLEQLHALPRRYCILETSATLRAHQKQLLQTACPHFFSRIVWLDHLPKQFNGIIFANEVLDALPVHCFRIENNRVLEHCITLENNQLTWTLKAPSQELNKKVLSLLREYSLPSGYESEVNLLLPHWIETVANLLHEGALIFFDYGYSRREYYHPDRSHGTLRCYFQHHCHTDPLLYVGLQDITASIDFTTLVESATQAGLNLAGYTTQTAFLLDCGIADFAGPPLSAKQYEQNQTLKQLMLPSEMGTFMKAIAFTKYWHSPLRGFSSFDQRRNL